MGHTWIQRIPGYFYKNVKSLGIFKNSINGAFCQGYIAILTKSFQVGCNLIHPRRLASCLKQVFFFFFLSSKLVWPYQNIPRESHPQHSVLNTGLIPTLLIACYTKSVISWGMKEILPLVGGLAAPDMGSLAILSKVQHFPLTSNAISKLTAFSEEMKNAILKHGLFWLFQ